MKARSPGTGATRDVPAAQTPEIRGRQPKVGLVEQQALERRGEISRGTYPEGVTAGETALVRDLMNHYDWCERHLWDFLGKIGVPDSKKWVPGIVGAHGDKAYSYRDKWAAAGIPFEHGVAIYLASRLPPFDQQICWSYTRFDPKLPRVEDWVIARYADWKDHLAPAYSPGNLTRLCPRCGSGDVLWCSISVRPYCRECGLWGATNYGSPEDAVRAWNARLKPQKGPSRAKKSGKP